MEYGSPFKKPPIHTDPFPGSWTPLHDKSPFILVGAESILDHITTNFNYKLPPQLKLELFTAGAQIVSGINIYLELNVDKLYVQALIYDPAPTKGLHEHKLKIKDIYVTEKDIFSK